MLHLRKFLVASLLAATAAFASPTTASATILPLDVCAASICDWRTFPVQIDVMTGDIWIKFESAQGAGDKGHIEGNFGDTWVVQIGANPVSGIETLFGQPFLTDMDQPIGPADVIIDYPFGPGFLDFVANFLNPVFVHDIHWPCIDLPTICVANFEAAQLIGTGGLFLDSNNDIVTGIWVPEPGTLALFAVGLAGLAFAHRRRSA